MIVLTQTVPFQPCNPPRVFFLKYSTTHKSDMLAWVQKLTWQLLLSKNYKYWFFRSTFSCMKKCHKNNGHQNIYGLASKYQISNQCIVSDIKPFILSLKKIQLPPKKTLIPEILWQVFIHLKSKLWTNKNLRFRRKKNSLLHCMGPSSNTDEKKTQNSSSNRLCAHMKLLHIRMNIKKVVSSFQKIENLFDDDIQDQTSIQARYC